MGLTTPYNTGETINPTQFSLVPHWLPLEFIPTVEACHSLTDESIADAGNTQV